MQYRKIESLFVEINLRKRKWFLNCSYNRHKNSILSHLECLNRAIDEHKKTWDNFIWIGDFNVGIDENSMKNVCDINCLKSVIKVLTCFRNSDNTTLNTLCIYLIQSIPTQQCFWNRHFRLPSFDNNWIQNGISKKIIA